MLLDLRMVNKLYFCTLNKIHRHKKTTMIKKQYLKTKPVCKVSFKISAEIIQSNQIAIVGNFNAWNPDANLMKKLKDGSFSATIEFPIDTTVQFRYLSDNTVWFNDEEADDFVSSGISSEENCLLVL